LFSNAFGAPNTYNRTRSAARRPLWTEEAVIAERVRQREIEFSWR
jgi:hypothetical protein